MIRRYLGLGVILFSWSASSGLAAQDGAVEGSAEKVTTAQRIDTKLVIDGELDEPEWDLVEPISDFVQQDPSPGEAITERTEVRILYDDEFLYFGIYCFDSEGEEGILVTNVQRDFRPLDGDVFSLLLDTFDDDRNGFLLSTNPFGAKRDTQVGEDGRMSNGDWDGIWHVQSKITESGWQAEMAIPFTTLRFRNTEEQVWGLNLQRRIRRKNESAHWAPIPRQYRISRISRAGRLEGLSGIRPGRNLYVKPYISMPVTRRQDDDVDFLPDAGLDLKYGLSSELTLDLTANTDFSQVEADDQQINLTRFSLFFPEKRDFFLENASAFQFGPPGGGGLLGGFRDLIPFFSRRIGLSQGSLVPILGGVRMTGKVGDYTVGLLSLQDDDFEGTPSTNFSVMRVRRDVLSNSSMGGIFVNKHELDGDSNRTYGADVNFSFYRFLDVSTFLLKTDTPEFQDKDLAGFFRAAWRGPLLTVQADHLSIQENFNAEVGFIPRKDIRKTTGTFGIRPRPRERIPWIREFEPSISMTYLTDQENVLQTRTINGRFSVRFQNEELIWFAAQSRFELLTEDFDIRSDQMIPAGGYQFNEYTLSLQSNASRMFSGSFRAVTGDFWDGEKDSYRFSFRFQPMPQFRSEITWSHDDVRLPSGDFDTELVTTRLNYSFNPSMFLNALIQYNSDRKELRSNIRFNLIHKPLSDFFLVYNERRSSTGDVAERALIAKVTYVIGL